MKSTEDCKNLMRYEKWKLKTVSSLRLFGRGIQSNWFEPRPHCLVYMHTYFSVTRCPRHVTSTFTDGQILTLSKEEQAECSQIWVNKQTDKSELGSYRWGNAPWFHCGSSSGGCGRNMWRGWGRRRKTAGSAPHPGGRSPQRRESAWTHTFPFYQKRSVIKTVRAIRSTVTINLWGV